MTATRPPDTPTVLPRDPEWIDTDAALERVVERVAAEPRYALDTEFHGERSYFPRLALVQLAWPGNVALVDPLAVDAKLLAPLFAGPGVMVAHAAEQDLGILERACGVVPTASFDTQIAAGFVGLGIPALTRLSEDLLGIRLPKGDRLTDWTKRPLSAGQRQYAAADVAHLLEIHDLLLARLRDLDREAWALAECEERLRRDRSPQDPDTAWWRLKGSRSLRGSARGVAQEVTAWRERSAQRFDLPARFVLSDLGLAGVIARAPQSLDEVSSIRGIEGGSGRKYGPEIVAAVERGLTLSDLRLPPRHAHSDVSQAPAVALIAAWLAQRASELKLETSLLGTRADLNELVARGSGRLTEGWRAEIVGEPIRGLMAGEMVLAVADRGSRLVLEPRGVTPAAPEVPAAQESISERR